MKLKVLANLDRDTSASKKLRLCQIDVTRTTSVSEERLFATGDTTVDNVPVHLAGHGGVEITCRTTTTVVRVKSHIKESTEAVDDTSTEKSPQPQFEKQVILESEIRPANLSVSESEVFALEESPKLESAPVESITFSSHLGQDFPADSGSSGNIEPGSTEISQISFGGGISSADGITPTKMPKRSKIKSQKAPRSPRSKKGFSGILACGKRRHPQQSSSDEDEAQRPRTQPFAGLPDFSLNVKFQEIKVTLSWISYRKVGFYNLQNFFH